MSEPAQLVVKLTFHPGEYERYLDHVVQPADPLDGWHGWLSAAQYYGDITPEEIMARVRHGMTVREWIAGIADDEWCGAQINMFSPEDGTWVFAVHGFAENYRDHAEGLNVLRQAQGYKTRAGIDHIAIVNWAFGAGFEHPVAIVEVERGASRFVSEAPEDHVAWATRLLEELQEIEDNRD